MQILYLSDAHIPSRATSGMQVMQMCAAFATHGADVTLVRPYRFGNRPEGLDGDVWSFYGVPASFRMRALPTPLTLRLASHRGLARVVRGGPLAAYLAARGRPGASPFVVYSRSLLGAWLALQARRIWGSRSACTGVFVEAHDLPADPRMLDVLCRAGGVVAISAALEADLLATRPGLAGRTLVEHDGFPVARPGGAGRDDLRASAGVPPGVPLVIYTGRINREKGALTLLAASRRLPEIHFLLVGKVYDNLDRADLAGANVTFTGFVAPADVRRFQTGADVLVLPTSAALPYASYTSPLKLFEYMASGRPIVASALPSIGEVLVDGKNGLLVPPDDDAALAAAISRLVVSPGLGRALADVATLDVELHSWHERAGRILAWIGSRRTVG